MQREHHLDAPFVNLDIALLLKPWHLTPGRQRHLQFHLASSSVHVPGMVGSIIEQACPRGALRAL